MNNQEFLQASIQAKDAMHKISEETFINDVLTILARDEYEVPGWGKVQGAAISALRQDLIYQGWKIPGSLYKFQCELQDMGFRIHYIMSKKSPACIAKTIVTV